MSFFMGNDDYYAGVVGKYPRVGEYNLNNHSTYNTTTSTITTTIVSIGIDCDITETGSAENIAYVVFMILILLASVIGNTLVVVATALSKQLRSRVTVYFIVSLAIADLVYAACLIPFTISMKLYNNRFCHSLGTCYWFFATDSFCNVVSMLSLFLIAIDRFIAINKPFRYAFLLPKSRVKKLIIGAWVVSALWAIAGIFHWKDSDGNISSVSITNYNCANKNYSYYVVSYFGFYLVPLIIMTVTYLSILQIALEQIQAIEATKVVLQPQQEQFSELPSTGSKRNFSEIIDTGDKCRNTTKNRKRRKELRATKSVAIVYFAFLICWFPNMVINVIIMFHNDYFQQKNRTLVLVLFYTFTRILPMVNTMLNPLIYSFSNRQFQKAFKLVLNKMRGKLENSPENSFDSVTRRTTRGHSMAGAISCSSTFNSLQSANYVLQSPESAHSTNWSPPNCKSTYIPSINNSGYDKSMEKTELTNNDKTWNAT